MAFDLDKFDAALAAGTDALARGALDFETHLQGFTGLFDCGLLQFIASDVQTLVPIEAVITGRRDNLEFYMQHLQNSDPRFQRINSWTRPIWRNSNLLTAEEQNTTALGHFLNNNGAAEQIGTSRTVGGNTRFTLSFMRGSKHGDFAKDYERPILTLNQSLITAAGLRSENIALSSAAAAYNSNAVYLDKRGRVVQAGRGAERCFKEGWIDASSGTLRAGLASEQQRLDAVSSLFGTALAGDLVPKTIVLRTHEGFIGGSATFYGIGPQKSVDFFGKSPVCVVILKSNSARLGTVEDMSAELGLAPAEAALAYDISNGLTLADHAQGKGISIETARGSLKSVFLKLGVVKQADLIRLVRTLWDVPN